MPLLVTVVVSPSPSSSQRHSAAASASHRRARRRSAAAPRRILRDAATRDAVADVVATAHGSFTKTKTQAQKTPRRDLPPVTSTLTHLPALYNGPPGSQHFLLNFCVSKATCAQKHEREVSREREGENGRRRARYKRSRGVEKDDSGPSPLSYPAIPETGSESAVFTMKCERSCDGDIGIASS